MKRVIHKSIVCPLTIIILIGFFQIGEANVLCIGEDGHIEIESNCLPCCNDIETTCETDTQADNHEEHDDCYNCSDLSLGNPFWSKRFSNFTTINISTKTVISLMVKTDTSYDLTIELSRLHNSIYNYKISPSLSSISSTVLIC